MRHVGAALVILAMNSAVYGSTIIAYTSFEEPTTVSNTYYTDLGDASVDHALVNHAGEPSVNYTSVGGELGFAASYINTRDDVGLTDGDYAGVSNYTGSVGSYTDGTQGYQISDADGMMQVALDPVTLTGFSAYEVSVDVFVVSTGYETAPLDAMRVWATIDGTTEIDLLNTSPTDINDLGIEGAWMTLSTPLVGSVATLSFSADTNSSYEAIFVDNVQFVGVPEPATMSLLCLGPLFLHTRRR